MNFEQKAALVDALLVCETMRNRNGRVSVAENLSSDIRDNIRTGNNARTDVLNIVSISEAYPGGITKLINVVRFHEGRSRGMEKVDEVMRDIYGPEREQDDRDSSDSQSMAENLDTKILEILHTYFQQHPGDPRMMYNELVKTSEIEPNDMIQCLYGLREKKWADFDLAEGGETGLVWLTLLGIRITADISRGLEGGSEGMKKKPVGKTPLSLKQQAEEQKWVEKLRTACLVNESLITYFAGVEEQFQNLMNDENVNIKAIDVFLGFFEHSEYLAKLKFQIGRIEKSDLSDDIEVKDLIQYCRQEMTIQEANYSLNELEKLSERKIQEKLQELSESMKASIKSEKEFEEFMKETDRVRDRARKVLERCKTRKRG